MSVQRCKREHTSMEFVCWQVRRERRINEFHREDYFLANIAKLILQANCKDPKAVKFEDFLLKFISEEKRKEEQAVEASTWNSKNFWAAVTGVVIDPKKE